MEPLQGLLKAVGMNVYSIQKARNKSEAKLILPAFNNSLHAGFQMRLIPDYRRISTKDVAAAAQELSPFLKLRACDEVQRRVFALLQEHGVPESIIEGCKPYITENKEETALEGADIKADEMSPLCEATFHQLKGELNQLRFMFGQFLLAQKAVLSKSQEELSRLLKMAEIFEEPEKKSVIQKICGFDPDILTLRIEVLELPGRLETALKEKYAYVYEVVELKKSEVSDLDNVGKTSVQSMLASLARYHLTLEMHLDPRVKMWVRTMISRGTGKRAFAKKV